MASVMAPNAMGLTNNNAASSSSASAVATASGYLALLKEDDPALQLHALEKLLGCVDTAWHEIAEALVDLERLAEEEEGAGGDPKLRKLAAAVASRVFYALEEPTQALRLALEAGEEYFSPLSPTPYEQRLVAAALDAYIRQKQADGGSRDDAGAVPSASAKAKAATAGGGGGGDRSGSSSSSDGLSVTQLQQMIHRLIATSCEAGAIEPAIGIALEAREMGVLREVLAGSDDLSATRYALKAAEKLDSKLVRVQAMGVVAESLQSWFDSGDNNNAKGASSPPGDDAKSAVAYELVLVYQHLKLPDKVADVLTTLLNSPHENAHGLMALQICFDLMDSGHSDFAKALATRLFPGGDEDEVDAASPEADAAAADSKPPLWGQVKKVLVGGFASELALSFLHKHSGADRFIMEQLRKGLEERSSRSSILHNAGVITHSYLYAGTTNDSFLRDYLDWMKKAGNWYVSGPGLNVQH
jgi:26S proteasome regulatory subunit N2